MKRLTIPAGDVLERYHTDAELAADLPSRPYFPEEYRLIQHGVDALLVFGGRHPRLIHNSGDTAALRRLVRSMDGRRDVTALSRLAGLPEATVASTVALLHDLSLLEDGRADDEDGAAANRPADPALGHWIGRMAPATGRNRNRGDAWARLRDTAVVVQGDEGLAYILSRSLTGNGLNVATAAVTAAERHLAILVRRGGADQPWTRLAAPPPSMPDGGGAAQCDVLLLDIAEDRVRIGPYLAGWPNADLLALIDALNPPSAEAPSPFVETLWSFHAAGLVLSVLVGAADNDLLHSCQTYSLSGGIPTFLDARPAFAWPGAPDAADLAVPSLADLAGDGRLPALALHTVTTMPPVHLHPRTIYRQHYTAYNIMAQDLPEPRLYGARTLALPPLPEEFGTPAMPERAAPMSPLERLAVLLWAGAGGPSDGKGRYRRLAPTGGNLRSVELVVLPRGIVGLDDRAYRYHAPDHHLEELGPPADAPGLPPSAIPQGGGLILLVGRRQRVHNKYRAKTFQIINADAGVTAACMTLAAQWLGGTVTPCAGLDLTALESCLPLPFLEGRYVMAGALCWQADPAQPPAPLPPVPAPSGPPDELMPTAILEQAVWLQASHALPIACRSGAEPMAESMRAAWLLRRLTLRRSRRTFVPASALLPESGLLRLLEPAAAMAGWMGANWKGAEPLFALRFWILAGPGGGKPPERLYRAGPQGGLVSCPPPRLVSVFNQDALNAAPLIVIISADVTATVVGGGAPAYRLLMQQVGAAGMSAWLAADAIGWTGVLSAGIRSLDVSRFLPDGRDTALCGIALGPREAGEEHP